ncbi:MAG: DNA primase [Sandaracinus sp.]|nr:DNA primase [Sandaracinus sp.]
MIPDDVLASIRERTDIGVLIGEYVKLKKSGASFKGLCPFHNEKTPSFYVHPQRGFFHCFGCQASGDVFGFLTRLEGLPFPEAARRLAERAGVEIPEGDPRKDAERRRERETTERIAQLLDEATGYYMKMMGEHPHGNLARECYEGRGVDAETAERFRLGYAPDAWDRLVDLFRQKQRSPRDAEAAGLVVPRRTRDGYYDRFRHRLMFPVSDSQGRIVAFSGRALPPAPGSGDEQEAPAKYINSPEGPLYTKGKLLYGLWEGRVSIRRQGWALLCEGNFDVVCLHQHGFDNAVAPLGTALTDDQSKLLRRFAERVVVLFDGDGAGRKATRAAFPHLADVGLPAKVVALPQGQDPDSFLREYGADALRDRIESAPGIVEHLIDEAASNSTGDAAATADAISSLGPVLKRVSNPVERRLYIDRIAQKFGVRDIDAVRQQLRRGLTQQRPRRRPEPEADAPIEDARPRQRAPRRPIDPLQGEVLGAMLDQPELFHTPEAEKISHVLTDPDLRAIFQATSRQVGRRGGVDASALLDEIRDMGASWWLEERLAVQLHEEVDSARRVLADVVPRLEKKAREVEARQLMEQAVAARRAGDDALADRLTRERMALLRGVLRK